MSMPTSTGARTSDGNGRPSVRDDRVPEIVHPEQDETRHGFKTTEFFLTIVALAGVLIATYADSDSLNRVDGWRFATFIVIAYVISRGLAKLASPNRTLERERLDRL